MNVRKLTDLYVEKRTPIYRRFLGPFLDDEGEGILQAIIANVFVRGVVLGYEANTVEIDNG